MGKKRMKNNNNLGLAVVINIIVLILFIIFIRFLISTAFACPQGQTKIIEVIDGDTFDAEIGENRFLTTALKTERIRLLGIDAYDKQSSRMVNKQSIRTGYSKERVKNFGILATNYAVDMLLGNCVMLESDYRDKGSFGRLLRYVKIDGKDFGSLVLERGLGNAYCGDEKIKRYNEYNELSEFKCK